MGPKIFICRNQQLKEQQKLTYNRSRKIKNIKYLHEKDQQRDAKVKMNLNKRFFLYYFDDSIDLEEDPNIAAQEMVISFPFMYIYIKSVGSYWELFHWVLLKVQTHWIEEITQNKL